MSRVTRPTIEIHPIVFEVSQFGSLGPLPEIIFGGKCNRYQMNRHGLDLDRTITMQTNDLFYIYHTQLAKMSFDEIFDLTGGMYFHYL